MTYRFRGGGLTVRMLPLGWPLLVLKVWVSKSKLFFKISFFSRVLRPSSSNWYQNATADSGDHLILMLDFRGNTMAHKRR